MIKYIFKACDFLTAENRGKTKFESTFNILVIVEGNGGILIILSI